MHVYSFKKNKSQLDLENDTFEQLKPGLSSYQDDPQKAAESLEPLMRIALGHCSQTSPGEHQQLCRKAQELLATRVFHTAQELSQRSPIPVARLLCAVHR